MFVQCGRDALAQPWLLLRGRQRRQGRFLCLASGGPRRAGARAGRDGAGLPDVSLGRTERPLTRLTPSRRVPSRRVAPCYRLVPCKSKHSVPLKSVVRRTAVGIEEGREGGRELERLLVRVGAGVRAGAVKGVRTRLREKKVSLRPES